MISFSDINTNSYSGIEVPTCDSSEDQYTCEKRKRNCSCSTSHYDAIDEKCCAKHLKKSYSEFSVVAAFYFHYFLL